MIMWLISAVSLTIVMVLCFVGVFIPKKYFDDNLAQCVGMAGMFMFCWPRLAQLLERQEITANTMPVFAQLVGHTGLALYAMGTAYKAWRHRPRDHGATPPNPASDKHPLRRVTDWTRSDRPYLNLMQNKGRR